jgi:flavin-dependent dehydrogenase
VRDRRTIDVLIAGAGPAGVGTAVALVRRGLDPSRLLMLDRARFPRSKPCGGGLTGHAGAALAALGLQLRVPSIPCGEGEVVYGGHRRVVPLGQPVHIVRREEFDADLVAQARAQGITVVEGEGIEALAPGPAGAPIAITTTAGRRLEARVLVGADGVGSVVRKHLHGGGGRPRGQPLRLSRLEIPAPRAFGPRMIYDFSALAEGLRGYVWLFPVPGGRLNVGAMHYPATRVGAKAGPPPQPHRGRVWEPSEGSQDSRQVGGKQLDRLLAGALARWGVTLPGPARGWPAWPYDPAAPVSAPGLLAVGDAAGIDALTGEGIAVGLEQALIAADFIAAGLASGDLRFAGYARALRQAVVGRELTLDARLARLLYAGRDYRSWLGLMLFDPRMLSLYAARVSGSEVLADRKLALLGALGRHLLHGRRRRRMLEAGPERGPSPG